MSAPDPTTEAPPVKLPVQPEVSFTSEVPWTDTPADCLVICCSDPRFERQHEDFVRALGYTQPKFVQVPSGVAVFSSLVAAAGFLHKGMGLILRKAVDLTGVNKVICIGHEDCGGYKLVGKHEVVQVVAKRFATKTVREVQHDHLKKAGRTISRQLGAGVDVSVYYADIVNEREGRRVKFTPVGKWSAGRPRELAV